MGCALCCGWDERYKLPLPKGLPAGQRWKCSHCPEQGSTWSRGWLKRIRPAGVPLPVYRLKVVHTQHNLGNNPRGRTLAPVHRTSLSGNRKRQLNVRSSENVLMWKRTQSRDYSGNCDIDLNSLNCWSMPSHCTLDNFPTKHMNMFVCRRDESMIVSIYTNVKKKRKSMWLFFSCCWLIHLHPPPQKKIYMCMFYIIWMKDICIVEYCTESCCVRRLYLFLKLTHFEFWFVLNTVFLALLFDCVNTRTSKWAVNKMQM